MNINYEVELIKTFNEIRSRNWIETARRGDECLGNTFEDLVGVKENNKHEADYHGIELKTHRSITSSLISLFSKAPAPRGVNRYLRETYGVIDPVFGKRVLNTTVAGNKFNTHRGEHRFKIKVDRDTQKMWLLVENSNTNEVLEDETHGKKVNWDFSALTTALKNKLKKIAIVYGEEKDENGKHYVKYTKMVIVSELSLEKLLRAIEKGDLTIDLRLGVYASGKKQGKHHDHGTAYRIKLEKLLEYGVVNEY